MSRPQTDRPVAGAKTGPSARATIAILDFGSQYTQLIARRVRESRVYCEIVPHDITPEELRARNVIGVILSCGPASVEIADRGGIFEGLSAQERAWVSHGDTVRRPPDGFSVVARTTSVPVAAMTDGKTRYAVQFHPEVAHTPHGAEILRNFLYRVCGATGDWTPAAFVEGAVRELRAKIGERHAICALSGGVDSAVAAALVARAIGDRLTCVFVDTGLLRANEAAEVVATFGPRLRLIHIDAADRFLAKLKDVEDPERKRAIIGEEFVRCFEEQAERVGRVDLLVQGTIYPDVIESRSRESKTSARIKTHHNVGGLPEVMALEVVEPLRRLFKDEVRSVGVQGDFRTYGALVALRAVTTQDFMTADWARLPYDLLERVSARVVNEVPGVNRVVYDISSKPPSTIEWE